MSIGMPGFDLNKRTVRAELNPLDKSTVVSIYPKKIDEKKLTTQPNRYVIEPGSYDKPSILVVTSASWWREIDENQPILEITNSSIQVANAIVVDFCNGLLGCDMTDKMPGLFFVPGEFDVLTLKTKHKPLLDRAAQKQKNWYLELVQMADSDWAKSNGNPRVIAEDMRIAARELGLGNKDWLQNFQNMETIRCVACGAMRNPLYPICASCHTIVDMAKYKELNLKSLEK